MKGCAWRSFLRTRFALVLVMLCVGRAWADPAVTNVLASQRAGTKLVDVYYDLSGTGAMTVSLGVSNNGGSSYGVSASSFSGDIGSVTAGSNLHIVWNAGADWNNQVSSQMRFEVTASDVPPPPTGMSLIPAGNFQMGDALDGESDAPVHTVSGTKSSTTSVPRPRLCRRSSASQSAQINPRAASFANAANAGWKQSATHPKTRRIAGAKKLWPREKRWRKRSKPWLPPPIPSRKRSPSGNCKPEPWNCGKP